MLKIWLCFCAVLVLTFSEEIDYHAHPKYTFEYGVNDPHTHDVKKQWETRDGDKVQGSYSLKEADGTIRRVDYHANDHTGFNAVVTREGHAVHPQVHPKVAVHETTHSIEHHGQIEHHGPIEYHGQIEHHGQIQQHGQIEQHGKIQHHYPEVTIVQEGTISGKA